jgi:hypothetical protein
VKGLSSSRTTDERTTRGHRMPGIDVTVGHQDFSDPAGDLLDQLRLT